ncbi:hypothetical protein E4O00_04115 [Treponema sp. OMZ 788]|uniref:hypothetical protein n=1 Tax=unclassified Treponema TaxID=2638727 RepID=UPI0020A54CDE|nr:MULTISPECIES: hypothetical protein [unclassified Treponema]UTC61712.1 hypothetical protein E4O05_09165 [Treponema sp. OMZ 787]UTC65323.1 hypothetical protein E4O00_04115 [Treponema sp. OMZ 788]
MVSNSSPLQALSQIAMPKISAGGRAYVPVKPSQVLYAHFKYVSGFAQAQGQSGMSIDKLRILNSIIDQLVSMKTNEAQKAKLTESFAAQIESEITENQIDGLLDYYHNQIKNTMIQTENIGYGGAPLPAAVLDLTA